MRDVQTHIEDLREMLRGEWDAQIGETDESRTFAEWVYANFVEQETRS